MVFSVRAWLEANWRRRRRCGRQRGDPQLNKRPESGVALALAVSLQGRELHPLRVRCRLRVRYRNSPTRVWPAFNLGNSPTDVPVPAAHDVLRGNSAPSAPGHRRDFSRIRSISATATP